MPPIPDFAGFFTRHARVMLQFSSGKDSAACLQLLRPWWDRLTVVWMNPGSPSKETREYMARIAAMVPHFKEIVGGQQAWIRMHGYPVDVVPFALTELGRLVAPRAEMPRIRVVPAHECCAANMWGPMAAEVIHGGYTGVIRGQKASDGLQSPILSGQSVDGREYLFPLDMWTDSDVIYYLGPNLPDPYKRGRACSLDCINCTAYVHEHRGWQTDLAFDEPEAVAEVALVHDELRQALQAHLTDLAR